MSNNSSSQKRRGTQPKEGLQRRGLLLNAVALVATGSVIAAGLGLPVLGGAFGPGMAAMAAENIPSPNIIYTIYARAPNIPQILLAKSCKERPRLRPSSFFSLPALGDAGIFPTTS